MGVGVRPDGLQIEEIPGFHQRWWIAKRVAWIICLLILASAAAGLFGDGPLSEARMASQKGTFHVEYHRLTRHQRPSEINIFITGGSTDEIKISFNRSYLSEVEIKGIEPEPESQIAAGDLYTYIFNRENVSEPTSVTFHVEPMHAGKRMIAIQLNSQDNVVLKQFVYP